MDTNQDPTIDRLGPSYRARFESLRPPPRGPAGVVDADVRWLFTIIDLLAPRPNPRVFWTVLARNAPGAEWIVGTFLVEADAIACADSLNSDVFGPATRVVKTVEEVAT